MPEVSFRTNISQFVVDRSIGKIKPTDRLTIFATLFRNFHVQILFHFKENPLRGGERLTKIEIGKNSELQGEDAWTKMLNLN